MTPQEAIEKENLETANTALRIEVAMLNHQLFVGAAAHAATMEIIKSYAAALHNKPS